MFNYLKLLKKYKLEFIKKINEAGDAYSFIFEKPAGLEWRAGQHFIFWLKHDNPDNRGIWRIFTVSSAPSEDVFMFTVRFFGDDSSSFKKALMKLKPGDTIIARGPSPIKDYFKVDAVDHYAILVGGIGITPARAVISEYARNYKNLSGTLFYANSSDEFVFKNDLEKFITALPDFKIKYYVSPRRISPEDLKKELNTDKSTKFLLSGPPTFVDNYYKLVRGLGVKKSNIGSYQLKSILSEGYK